MSDAVMVPSLEGLDDYLENQAADAETVEGSFILNEWAAAVRALAASPSVGGWGSSADADTHRAAEGAVVDDRLHDAIRQLRQHMTTIQAAKEASAAGQPQGMGPIWNLVNALPAIVRQLDAAELDIEAAFERYEDAAPPPVSTGSRPQEAVPTELSDADGVVLCEGDTVEFIRDTNGHFRGERATVTYAFPVPMIGGWTAPHPSCFRHVRQPADGCSSNEGAGE